MDSDFEIRALHQTLVDHYLELVHDDLRDVLRVRDRQVLREVDRADLLELDVVDLPRGEESEDAVQSDALVGSARFGRVQRTLSIERFSGVAKIAALDAYPMKYHHDEAALRSILLTRARKWVDLYGVHHMQYKGTATMRCLKYKVWRALLQCS